MAAEPRGDRRVRARGGLEMPALGMGTWRMGADAAARGAEVTALQLGLDLGMGLIDTAEMYHDGQAEAVVGEAIAGRRDEVVVVTKVRPEKASRQGTIDSAEASLRRLRTDRIDLFLLHDSPVHPLAETLAAFEVLKRDGKIRHYGVSNFDIDAMRELEDMPGGTGTAANQLRYALTRRGLEHDILPWCNSRDIAVMAYSPLDEGRLPYRPELEAVAARHGVRPACIAIAWTMRHPLLVTIPKASDPAHVRENARALEIRLSDEELAALESAYPRPAPGFFDIWGQA